MVQNEVDTIVAEATPRGRGGIGIVRVSGPQVTAIAEKILKKLPIARQAEHLPFFAANGEILDQGIALFFKAPHSFTGEDVLELQGHGGPVIMDSLIGEAVKAGARLAEPGEFSLRAFLNNKIDLLQAEAIADLINANSKQAARSAMRSLQGVFSKTIDKIIEELIELRMYVEAAIDFPEEEIDFLRDERLLQKLKEVVEKLERVQKEAEQGVLMSEGLRMAIIGRPNAGKSSLLNALAARNIAIVTDIPGTTRDVLREKILIDGFCIEMIDTAGLREGADEIEQEGIRRAFQEMSLADHLLLVVDANVTSQTDPIYLFSEWLEKFPPHIGITILQNKIDLTGSVPNIEVKKNYTVVSVSVKTGAGMPMFREYLKKVAGFSESSEGNFMARRRHLEALKIAQQHLVIGVKQLQEFNAGELLAEELYQAQLALNQITGKFTTDDLLGKIFSEFCIGK